MSKINLKRCDEWDT